MFDADTTSGALLLMGSMFALSRTAWLLVLWRRDAATKKFYPWFLTLLLALVAAALATPKVNDHAKNFGDGSLIMFIALFAVVILLGLQFSKFVRSLLPSSGMWPGGKWYWNLLRRLYRGLLGVGLTLLVACLVFAGECRLMAENQRNAGSIGHVWWDLESTFRGLADFAFWSEIWLAVIFALIWVVTRGGKWFWRQGKRAWNAVKNRGTAPSTP